MERTDGRHWQRESHCRRAQVGREGGEGGEGRMGRKGGRGGRK